MPQNRAPIREQLFRIVGLIVGFVVGIVAVVVVEIVLGLDTGIWLTTLIFGIVLAIGIVVAGAVVGGRLGQRLVGDCIEVAMREQGSKKWRHGRLTVGRGQISFQPYAYQVRIPKGEPLELRVTRLGVDTGRRPPLRQIWSVNPQLHIVDLETDQGPKELAALPSRLMELQVRLGQ